MKYAFERLKTKLTANINKQYVNFSRYIKQVVKPVVTGCVRDYQKRFANEASWEVAK